MKKILLSIFVLSTIITSVAQNIPSFVPTEGLEGWWPFNGNVINQQDTTQKGNAFEANLINDRFGNQNGAYKFDGINDYIDYNYSLPENTTLPLSMWSVVRIDEKADPQKKFIIFTTDEYDKAYKGVWFIVTANRVEVSYGDGSGVGPNSRRSTGVDYKIEQGTWFTISAVINGPNDVNIFINGEKQTVNYSGNGSNFVSKNNSNSISGYLKNDFSTNVGQIEYAQGEIDEFGLWNRALTSQEIKNLHNSCSLTASSSPSFVPTEGLEGWWPFNGNVINQQDTTQKGNAFEANLINDRFGKQNGAYKFDGINDYIDYNYSLPENTTLPLSMWSVVRIDEKADPQKKFIIFTTDEYDKAYKGVWFIVTANRVEVSYGDGSGVGPNSRRSTGVDYKIEQGTWFTISAVINGPNDVNVFINGEKQIVNYSGNGGTFVSKNNSNAISGYLKNDFSTNVGQIEYAQGEIDEFGLWNRALTSQEIKNLHNSCSFDIVNSPQNQLSKLNTTAEFNVQLSTTPYKVKYQWQSKSNGEFQNIIDGEDYNGTKNQSLTILNTVNDEELRCIITSNNCSEQCFYTSKSAKLTISKLTIINDKNSINNFTIFPNPANYYIIIQGNENIINKEYVIYNEMGTELLKGKLMSNKTQINLNKLPIGLYFIKIENHINQKFKIVK